MASPKIVQATPDTLAEAGFYYNPSYDGRDNATCYMCGKDIEDWESDDDPFDIHWDKCGWTCGWAAARCALREDMDQFGRFVFHEKERVPTSKPMEKARLETYSVGDGWKHDRTKNHGSNSKKMAQAGFVYTPQYAGDDLATCLYCNVSLSGWEPEDDPMCDRSESFYFLILMPIMQGRTQETRNSHRQHLSFPRLCGWWLRKPPSKQATKPPSRTASKSKHQDIVLPTKIHDGDPDGDGASDSAASSVPASVKSGKGRKGRSTSKARDSSAKGTRLGRSTSKKKESDEEVEEQEVEEAPKKRGRAQSKSAARSVSSKFSEKKWKKPLHQQESALLDLSQLRALCLSQRMKWKRSLRQRRNVLLRAPARSRLHALYLSQKMR
ncbi:hypothetical protein BDQ17DRAFT_337558 [Cyathus striatus]|nr:hypothetical protein BDQ17DRAFT_337558 [Cyathus striatus]